MILLLSSLLFARPPRGNAEDNFAELEDQLVLRFHDAITGNPIPGATITFEGEVYKTKPDGSARFDFPIDLNDGEDTRKVRFHKEGYTTTTFDVPFQVGSLWFNRFSVSPEVPLKKLRIVLDWGTDPQDLDAHLMYDGQYHISYRNMKSIIDEANLDRDDRDGEGPETITLHNINSTGTYRYVVHDYSNRENTMSKSLSNNGARVHIYSSNGREQTFYAPQNTIGNTWSVFRIENGTVIPEQKIDNQ